MAIDEKKLAVDRIRECIGIAARFYRCDFPNIETKFDLTGRVGGYFCVRQIPGSDELQLYFRLNKDLLTMNFEEFHKQIIPHEVSHYITRKRWGMKVKPHGSEWRSVMTDCFGLVPDRCHQMDTSLSSQRPYIYRCSCQEFQLSKRMHNSIRRGRTRSCRTCHKKLLFVREDSIQKQVSVIDSLFISTAGGALLPAHIQSIQSVVAAHQVDRIITDSLTRRASDLRALAKALNVPMERVSIHPNDDTLPGRVSHAILFFEQNTGRQERVARAFESRGVKLRRLKSEAA